MWTRTDFQRPPFMTVDCDGHLNDWKVDFRSRLPSKYADWAPRVVIDGGRRVALLEGKTLNPGQHLIAKTQPAAQTVVVRNPKQWSAIWQNREGEQDPHKRIPDMDYEGIDVSVIFGGGQADLNNIAAINDPGFAAAMARAYNDWAVKEYCGANQARLKAPAYLPLHDAELALQEVYHAKEIGAVGVQIWPTFKRTPLHDPKFEPVWSAVEEVDLPICIHASNYMGWGPESNQIRFFKHSFLAYDMMLACCSFAGYGILQRHPKLRVGFFETMAGWAIWLADRLDEHWKFWSAELPWQDRSPGDWIRSENCHFSAQAVEKAIPQFMQVVSPNNIGFNSDYSHADGASPDSVKLIYTRTDMTEEQKRKVLGANTARFFKIPVQKPAS